MRPLAALTLVLLLTASGALTRWIGHRTGGGAIHYTEIQYGHKTMGDVTFSHVFHVREAGLTCVTCHTALFTMNRETFARIRQAGERAHATFDRDALCGHCHNNRTAFNTDNCNLCHEKP